MMTNSKLVVVECHRHLLDGATIFQSWLNKLWHDVQNEETLICAKFGKDPGTLTLSPERQSARMSKITNDGLVRSGTGCYIVVPIWQQWALKG